MDPDTTRSLLPALTPDVIGVWVAAILTLVVYSHLLKDNVLSRLAQHLFVGVAAGYAGVIAWHGVIAPRLVQPILDDPTANGWLLLPGLLGIFLIVGRTLRPLSWLATWSLAFLFGLGIALSVGGALVGILVPQLAATMLSLNPNVGLVAWVNNFLIVVGTISALLYFTYTTRPDSPVGRAVSLFASIGKWVLLVAFGAILGTTVLSRVSLLIGRVQFLLEDFPQVLR